MFRNPLEERGRRVCTARNTLFFKKKFSPRTTPSNNQSRMLRTQKMMSSATMVRMNTCRWL